MTGIVDRAPRIAPIGACVLVAALLTAGCIGLTSPTTDDGSAAPSVRPSPDDVSSALVATVTDPALSPIEDANVTVETSEGSRTARTDATGQAQLEDLAPGRAILTVQAAEHRGRQLTVDLPAGETLRRSIVLTPLPEDGPFVQRFEFHGFFECSATYLIVTGDCLAAARAVSEQAGGPSFNATNERFTFPFPVHEDWTTIHVTQTWEDPAVGTGSMMRINLEPRNPNKTGGHSPQYADADGTSPLELTIQSGELHENASSDEMVVPEQGGWLRTRSFHLGLAETHNPAGTEFLGVGGAVQQAFTVTIAVRYG